MKDYDVTNYSVGLRAIGHDPCEPCPELWGRLFSRDRVICWHEETNVEKTELQHSSLQRVTSIDIETGTITIE